MARQHLLIYAVAATAILCSPEDDDAGQHSGHGAATGRPGSPTGSWSR